MEQKTLSAREIEQREIDLLDLFGFYMSKLPLLIAAVLVGALIAGLYTKLMVPNRYTAVSQMYMVSASSDSVVNLTDLNIGTSLSNDYVVLMKSRPVLEDIIDKLELKYTYKQLDGMISLSVIPSTRIIKIHATSTDPVEAMDIANQMAKTSKVQLPKVMEAPSPSIVEGAVLPTQKSSPSLTKNVLIGAMLLLILVLGILTVIYLMDDTIKTPEDVEKEFGVMPLSSLPGVWIEEFHEDDDSERKRSRRRGLFNRRKGGKA